MMPLDRKTQIAPRTADQADRGLPLPRLAVVLPCYNSEAWLARSIGSVLAQDYPDLQVIAVDDGSTDGTLAALRAFGDAITVETGPNRGACHARNRGLAIAVEQGVEYVVFLDSDDQFEGPILRHAATVAVETGADLVVSGIIVVSPGGGRVARKSYSGRIAPETAFLGWSGYNAVVPGGLLWRCGFVEQVGWDESLSQFQDTDIVMRALLRRPLVVKNDTGVLLYMRDNPQSISKLRSRKHAESRLRVFSSLLEQISGTSFAPAIPLLRWKLYKNASENFLNGYPDLGRQAVRVVAATSMQGPPWAWKWTVLFRLIGLETRTRLRQKLASYRQRPAPHKTGVAP